MPAPVKAIWITLGVLNCGFHLGLIFYGLMPNLVSRPLHMALVLPWVFLFGAQDRIQYTTGVALTAVGLGCCLWIAANHAELRNQYGFLEGTAQVWMAAALLLIAIAGGRRMIGWPLPAVALASQAHGLFGQYLPGKFGHSGTPLRSFLGTLTIAAGGLWDNLTGVSVGVVAIFVIFGTVLNAGEAGLGLPKKMFSL